MIARYEKELRETYGQFSQEGPTKPAEPEPAREEEASAEMPSMPPPSDRPFPEEPPEEASKTASETDNGKITVMVNAGREAVPLDGVLVLIDRTDDNDPARRHELVWLLETDPSGRTETVTVKTVSRELSQAPGHEGPFATYYVSVWLSGYQPVNDRPVDVFGGQTSLLEVELVPKAENLGGA